MPEQEAKPLSGKVILITGASRGIGAAAAKRVGRGGATVIINYLQNRDGASKVLDAVEKAGGKGMIFQADVTQLKPVEAMGKAVQEKFGGVDVLVSNAYFPFEVNPIHQLSWEGLKKAFEEEIGALHNLARVFVPLMSAKKTGKIIVVSSRVAQQPLPRLGAHAAAKAALETLANTMAIELGPLGITVNVLIPALTITDASAIMPEEFKERVRRSRPLQKHLYPEDIAGTIAFLASDDTAMMTGSHILITGGSHLQI